jgi:alkylated DNA repair dioxygenase AlkB
MLQSNGVGGPRDGRAHGRRRRGGAPRVYARLVRHWPVGLFQPDVLADELPTGLQYRRDLISADEERALLDAIGGLQFSSFEMRGVVARRRVAFFGRAYDDRGDTPNPPLPVFLIAVRERLAAWLSLDPTAFEMALINEYQPGSPIGWHRDAPQYEVIAGVSLLSACRMKFRRYVPPAVESRPRRTASHEIRLEPRSAYAMDGPARAAYEHHIPAVTALRYSITFRTLRGSGANLRVSG